MKKNYSAGRVTLPTDKNMDKKTLEIMKEWGCDALRDCDGTEFPEELKQSGARIYRTYYTTRKDNAWALEHPDEIQQMYVMTKPEVSNENTLRIELMKYLSKKMLKPNGKDYKRWWEVIDRTSGEVVPLNSWEYIESDESVVIKSVPYHEYTVSFFTFIMWDPVHMYNSLTNGWNTEKEITFDIRQEKTHEYSIKRLENFIKENSYVDVIRFTTFFHLFTLIFDQKDREKYVDWYGYSSSVSPYILEKFEKEVGYPFRAEYIIDQGYYNGQYRVPSKEYKDFMSFQNREVCSLVKELVDVCHRYNKEAMMFLGDHWIGTEPYLDEFKKTGVDSIVGSVGNGSTLRMISDIKNVKCREGRLLPYFFPDTFHKGGNPKKEAESNWVQARRAILRSPLDRIGYGGYLSLATEFPSFMRYEKKVCNEFRDIYDKINGVKPYSFKKVAILNAWGKCRSWGAHMVHHALYKKENYSYAGVEEILSGSPYDVSFISFDDVLNDKNELRKYDAIFIIGDADTAHSGGEYWENEKLFERVREYVYNGGGIIGVGEPSGHQKEGHYIQLWDIFGIEKEVGFTLGYDKYNTETKESFITQGVKHFDFGEGKKNIYALDCDILLQNNDGVQASSKEYGKGRSVYISGLPYSSENVMLLHKIILWCTHSEELFNTYMSSNEKTEFNYYPEKKMGAVVNNSNHVEKSIVYFDKNKTLKVLLKPFEIKFLNL